MSFLKRYRIKKSQSKQKADALFELRKRKRQVYEMKGRVGFCRVYVLPKNKRYRGVDGIRLEFCSDSDFVKGKSTIIDLKDWEALVIIHGLSQGLLVKKRVYTYKG